MASCTNYVQDYIVVPTTSVYIGIVIYEYIDFSAVSTSMGEKKTYSHGGRLIDHICKIYRTSVWIGRTINFFT